MNEQERLIKVISDVLGVGEPTVTPDTLFAEDLGADFYDLLYMISAVEKEFDIYIPDENIEGMIAVKDVLSYIRDNR